MAAIGLARTFDSLRVRNYRMFFGAQIVNWTGTWVEWVAMGWLVLRLTHSGFALGLVMAVTWSPILVLGAWGGVLADRFNKRRVLLLTNSISAGAAAILGIATVTGVVTLWLVIAIALVLGSVTALDNPTRQTFTMEMVGRDRLPNAVSLNTATFTIARVGGPAIAGFVITEIGIGQCFLVNTFSFLPIICALLFMRKEELGTGEPVEQKPGQVREGLRYVLSKPVLRTLLTMMAVIGTLQYNFHVLMPLLAKDTFDGDAGTLGLLGSAIGIGMLVGSLTTATIGRSGRKMLLGAGFALGTVTLLVAGAPELWQALILLGINGVASMAFIATMNATLQLNSSDAMRGRVMALYFVLFLGSTPIGAPLVGWIAEAFSPRASLAVGGITTIAACVYGLFRLPDLRADLQTAEARDGREAALESAG